MTQYFDRFFVRIGLDEYELRTVEHRGYLYAGMTILLAVGFSFIALTAHSLFG